MCQRTDTSCSNEYRKLWNREQDKARRNEIVRQYRQRARQGGPAVYGILFPAVAVLKVGLTTTESPAIYVGIARRGARNRGWDPRGSSCIWKNPGDVRTEAWIQATLAFRWPGAFTKYQNRLCEWFDISGLTPEVIIATLDEVYQGVPADHVPIERRSTTARDTA
jgi:hypothetical protein